MILLLDIILLSRLVFLQADHPLTGRRLIGMLIVQAIGFSLFRPGIVLAVGFLMLMSISTGIFLADRQASRERVNRNRVTSLIAIFIVLNVLFSPAVGMLHGGLGAAASAIAANLLALVSWHTGALPKTAAYLAGLLLVLGEANYFIRWILGRFTSVLENETNSVDDGVDNDEFNAGRIIGIIERLLIYQFMLLGAHAAIGFVLAAKGFTRFRELEKRTFAEYVLIGTLLSAACAVFVALAVNYLL